MDGSLYKEIGKLKTSDDLVLGNLRLVVHLAKKYQGMGLSLDDLIHEGTIGLCQAKNKYDGKKGKFSSYASLWIKATIRQALNNKSRMIRVPSYLAGKNDSAIHVSELQSTFQGTYEPQIDSFYAVEHTEHKISILLGKLSNRQQDIIKMKFGIGCDEMKTADIAKKLGLTIQAVNSNIRTSLKIMKSI